MNEFDAESQADRDLENMSEEDIEVSVPELESDLMDLQTDELNQKDEYEKIF